MFPQNSFLDFLWMNKKELAELLCRSFATCWSGWELLK